MGISIWLLKIGEPTPHDGNGTQRALRMGILSKMLERRGHRVLWWTSTFDHHNHRQRFESDVLAPVSDMISIQYIRSCGYDRNVSLRRLRDHRIVARRFTKLAEVQHQRPDVILASLPTPDLALAAVSFGKRHNIPVFLDIRDLWPDVFFDLLPAAAAPFVRCLSFPMRSVIRRACINATGIIGLTDAFVDWGLGYAGRSRSECDEVFPMGYMLEELPQKAIDEGREFWRGLGVAADHDELIVVFFGALGRGFDLAPVIEAAEILGKKKSHIRFVICGAGESANALKEKAAWLGNIIFPGWVNSAQIRTLLDWADVGIAPYIASENFINNLPNKPAEYLSGGLAVALSLEKGMLHDLLVEEGCGFGYQNDGRQLARELHDLSVNPDRLKDYQKNALRVFKEKLDGEVVYNRAVDFLENAARNGR